MIGIVLLATLAVLVFFGITDSFFSAFGVANWVAFLVVAAFAVASMFPPLVTETGVSFSYAGFFLPLLLGVVTLFALGLSANLLRAVVGSVAVAGIVIAARVAFVPVSSYTAAVPSILIAGFAGGIAAFAIGQHRLAALGALLIGCVLGDFTVAMLFRFVTESTYLLQLGQNGMFDSLVLALVTSGCVAVLTKAVSRAFARRRGKYSVPIGAAVPTAEAGQDNDLPEGTAQTEEDDLYDDYFEDNDKDE